MEAKENKGSDSDIEKKLSELKDQIVDHTFKFFVEFIINRNNFCFIPLLFLLFSTFITAKLRNLTRNPKLF